MTWSAELGFTELRVNMYYSEHYDVSTRSLGTSASDTLVAATAAALPGYSIRTARAYQRIFNMGNGMNKVLPGLYVGNYRDSKDSAQLERYKITHILAIHDAARRLHSDKHYLCIMAADTPDQNLSQYFSVCNDFIHSARLRGGNVLIHCLAGMSRSVTVAVAYIMSTTNLSWKDALKVVRVGRAVANPNVGFQQQLEDFESTRLQEERRRLRERFPSLALSAQDAEACRLTLINYEGLALARELCEGNCPMGRNCPTGICRQPSKRNLRRKSSTSSQSSGGGGSTGRTPPQTPRLLPSAPPSPALSRSGSASGVPALGGPCSRPRSGPAGLHYYTSSAPPSRAISRVDLSASVACSSTSGGGSTLSLSAIGRSSPVSSGQSCSSSIGLPLTIRPSRYAALAAASSAPTTPRATPPVSPQHWPRRQQPQQPTHKLPKQPMINQSQQQQQQQLPAATAAQQRPGTPQPKSQLPSLPGTETTTSMT